MMVKPRKSRLWVMVGIPGSGKSYWITNHVSSFTGSIRIVSRDTIRFNLLGENDEYFSKENEVFNRFIDKIKEGLDKNENVIADATHINSNSRGKLFRALGDSLKDVEVNAIVMDTCLAKCLEQNEMREGRSFVPEAAIHNMWSNFSMPTFEEGFDNIYIYGKEGDIVTYKIMKKE